MPIIRPSSYLPPPFFSNPHLQTVWAGMCRVVSAPHYRRERIITPDDDFLDLDRIRNGSERAVILCHGLEGNSGRSYMLGMARAMGKRGRDVTALNFRNCSGEPNRKPGAYHSGATHDLETVIQHILRGGNYRELALIGFSLGGNLVLKYLGEQGAAVPPEITKAVAFSVPCDLASAAAQMGRPENRLYLKRFLLMLKQKLEAKMKRFPDRISLESFDEIKDFHDFDGRYTAPLHGFSSAEDYWEKSSSKPHLTNISIPTLVVNAQDDPFLSPLCFPVREAYRNPNLYLEMPARGGHVGFVSFHHNGEYWSEQRAARFLETTRGLGGMGKID